MGFEPMIRVLQTLALASWPRRRTEGILSKDRGMVKHIIFERAMGSRSIPGKTNVDQKKQPSLLVVLET